MALTKVKAECLLCKQPFEDNDTALFVGMVRLTSKGRTSGESGMAFGGPYVSVPEGKLRIKHLPGGKPRGVIHVECWNSNII